METTTTQRAEPHRRVAKPSAGAKATAAAAQLAFLAQLTRDVRDAETPIGAFLAALPRVPKRRAKSSSERGRAFRERQQRYEEELEEDVEKLKREIISLDMAHRAREAQSLNRRTALTGSLVQTVREYHRLFVHGLPALPSEPRRAGVKRGPVDHTTVSRIQLQEEFIRRVIAPTAIVGNMVGPEASIVQWRRYTQSHATMTAVVMSAEVIVTSDDGNGTDEDIVTVVAQCLLRVRLSRETFKMMFPHVLSNEAFLQRLLGKEISYHSVKRFQFASDGRIVTESVDVDFMGGLMNAGCSLVDIATLMGGAAITRDSMIIEVEDDTPGVVDSVDLARDDDRSGENYLSPPGPDHRELESSVEHDTADCRSTPLRPLADPAKSDRLSMSFLLACDTIADRSGQSDRAAPHS